MREQKVSGIAGKAPLVCLVSPLPPPAGGIARWTSMVLAHADARTDVHLTLVNTAVRFRSAQSGSTIIRIASGACGAVLVAGGFAASLFRDRPDVVHVNTSGSLGLLRDALVLILARAARVPVVYHIRFGRVPDIAAANTAEWRLMRRIVGAVDAVICLDVRTAETIATRSAAKRVDEIANCVDLDELPARVDRRDGNAALFVGWVVPTKGVRELVEAWRLVRRPGWRLDVVGPAEPSFLESLRQEVNGLDDVNLIGPLPHGEVLERIANCDLLVLPSYTEGFPNVVAEAMALRRPVVATAVGAIPEMLADGAGLVVAPRDVTGLAAAMARVMGDARSADGYGSRAEARARARYSLDGAFSRYLAVWRDVWREP